MRRPLSKTSHRDFFERMLVKYPGSHYATHPTGDKAGKQAPRADHLPHLFSGSLERGVRIWAFETEAERDAFLTLWPKAQPAKEPEL